MTFDMWCGKMQRLLERLSDLEYQRRAWLEGSIPNVLDFPSECFSQFFDDMFFEEAVEQWKDQFRPEVLGALKALAARLDRFNPVPRTKVLLADPDWLETTRFANKLRRDAIKNGWDAGPGAG